MYVYIGIAGALGAISRYLIGNMMFSQTIFPFATLSVNLIGCYALAFLTTRVIGISHKLKTAIGTGFLGSFTTFSAFSVESVRLFQSGNTILAIVYIALSMVGGIIMIKLGWKQEVSK